MLSLAHLVRAIYARREDPRRLVGICSLTDWERLRGDAATLAEEAGLHMFEAGAPFPRRNFLLRGMPVISDPHQPDGRFDVFLAESMDLPIYTSIMYQIGELA